jgi:hypothetical protein
MPYTLIEGATWAEESARAQVAPQDPLRQVLTFISGEPPSNNPTPYRLS